MICKRIVFLLWLFFVFKTFSRSIQDLSLNFCFDRLNCNAYAFARCSLGDRVVSI